MSWGDKNAVFSRKYLFDNTILIHALDDALSIDLVRSGVDVYIVPLRDLSINSFSKIEYDIQKFFEKRSTQNKN